MSNTKKSLQEIFKANHVYALECTAVQNSFTALICALSEAGAKISKTETLSADAGSIQLRIEFFCVASTDADAVKGAAEKAGAKVTKLENMLFEVRRGGAIKTISTKKIDTLTDLRMVYTPGVAEACKEIVNRPEAVREITGVQTRVAIVSDGTAVLGLGDIGAEGSLPVMEGKAAIFAEFVGISGVPIVLNTKDPDEIVKVVEHISPAFGAIQLEDIAAPACFEIEDKLKAKLNIPVFHDDQHATATVVLAALINAMKITGKKPEESTAIVVGAGAAGYAITKILLEYGLKDIVVYDAGGAIYRGRTEMMNPYLEKLAEATNAGNIKGGFAEGFKGRDIFVGVARADLVSKELIASMADNAIAFPLSNPKGEISVEDAAEAGAAVTADGRTINNALAFPGIFRGALDAEAKEITEEMKLAAATALAEQAPEGMLLPDMIDRNVHARVTKAVAEAAKK
ncbi:MAG: NADP-dependent malic enzyme [Phycisphaerae bacterium]|jgi:malate dehydrogenase (oxaloacetate-decarboxylating)